MIIGIDFGTCFSHVSVMIGAKVLEDTVTDAYGDNLIPSTYIMVDGKEYFGNEAKTIGLKKGLKPITGLKTKIRGREYFLKCPCGGDADNQTYGDILKKMLNYLMECVKEKHHHQTIEYITIAAPVSLNTEGTTNAEYNALLKDTLKEITDLDDDHIFVKEEPIMGAYSYICNCPPKTDQTILVFDLGGGTLDTSIVEYKHSTKEIKVLKSYGKEIGGNQWTYALSTLVKTTAVNNGFPRNYQYPPDFEDLVENLKKNLSVKDSAFIHLPIENTEKKITISRDNFEIQTAELLEECKKCILEMMEEDNISFDDIDLVVLVGGSSRMPQIRNMFLEQPGMNDSKIISHCPDLAISNGAAQYSKKYCKDSGGISIGPEIREYTSHTYGVEISDAYSNAPLVKNIIFKGEEYVGGNLYKSPDCTFQPKSNEITHTMLIKVYESNCSCKDCDSRGCIHLDKGTIPLGSPIRIPIPEGYSSNSTKYKIQIAFNITSDNILTVIVSEPSNGNQKGRKLAEQRIKITQEE